MIWSTVPATRGRLLDELLREESRSRRGDIDGLRALAVALVVTYHVWFGRVSGGVDVFLLISAYFLTSALARRVSSDAPLALGTWWGRRFRRLLPAAAVTILGTLVAVWWAFPESSWPTIWAQAWASLLYLQNVELASTAVDYFARDEAVPSPFLHFWSLSLQGQVFLLWPLLILGAAAVARRSGRSPAVTLLWMFGGIFVASLTYSIVVTAVNQEAAYFDTAARLWEFALGSILALVAPLVRWGALTSAVLGWGGLLGLILCGVVLDVRGGFPGFLALWPTLCAAAVMLAGRNPVRFGPTRMLSGRALGWLGGIAYALYLTHWPILVTWLTVSGKTSVGIREGAVILAISVGAAVLLARLVERPLQRDHAQGGSRRSWMVVAASVLVVTVPLATWQLTVEARAAFERSRTNPGAAVLLPGGDTIPVGDTVVPVPALVGDDWVGLDGACTDTRASVDSVVQASCSELRAVGPATGRIVVVGDSHAGQWAGVLEPIARARNMEIVSLTKGGCAFARDEPEVPGAIDCAAWRAAVPDHIRALAPDLIVGMATRSAADDAAGEHALAGLEATIASLSDTDAHWLLFRDNPRFTIDMYECIERGGGIAEVAGCARPVDEVLAATNPAEHLRSPAVDVVDLTEYICPDGVCPAVIGGVAVYMDDDHLSGTYARTLAPLIESRL